MKKKLIYGILILVMLMAAPAWGQRSASVTPTSIDEYSINTSVLTITLVDDTFNVGISGSDFTLVNAPSGLSIESGGVNRTADKEATINLQFSGDIDADITNFEVTANTSGLKSGLSGLTTNSITLVSHLEPLAALTPAQVMESSLNGAVLTITLTDESFENPIPANKFTLVNGPAALSINYYSRVSSTVATLTLSFSGGISSDYTTFHVDIDGGAVTSGTGLSTNNITLKNEAVTAMISGSGEVCQGQSYNIRVDLTGNPNWQIKYTIDGGSETTISNISSTPYYISASTEGDYALTYVKDGTNEVGTTSGLAALAVNPLPTPSVNGDLTPCEGTEQVYNTTANVGSTYLWTIDTSDGSIVGPNNRDSVVVQWVYNHSASKVRVTETTSKGCPASTPDIENISFVAGASTPTITTTPTSGLHEFCEGSSLTLRSTSSSYGYLWSTSATTRNIVVTNAGSFTVQVKNSSGCYSEPSSSYSVSRNPKPSATLSVNGSNSICVGTPGQFKIDFYSGTSPFDFSYNDGSTTIDKYNQSANPYLMNVTGYTPGYVKYTLLSVTDDKGCDGLILKSKDSIDVISKPTITFGTHSSLFSTEDNPVTFTATPTPGIFSSMSGAVTTNGTFYPNLADTGSNYIKYTTTGAQCNAADSFEVTVLVPQGDIVAPAAYNNGIDKYIFCLSEPISEIGGSAVNRDRTKPCQFFGPGIYDTYAVDSIATFDPLAAGVGRHNIEFWYYAYTGNPLDFLVLQVKATFVVDDVGDVTISGFAPEYCANADSIKVVMSRNIPNYGVAGYEASEALTGPGISGSVAAGYYFNPKRAGGAGMKTITYLYTRTFSQCNITKQVSVTIHPLPILNFMVKDSCMLTTPGTDSILFYNLTDVGQNVASWEWNFGDGTYSSLKEPWHDYNSEGSKQIVLKATNNFGCINQKSKIVEFGAISKAIFDWENECYGDLMKFTASNDGGKVVSFRWKFGDGSSWTDTITKNPTHTYSSSGNYYTRLRVINNFGCFDSLEQRVPVRPTVTITEVDPYFQDFQSGDGGWVAEAVGSSQNSWAMGIPAKTIIKDPGNTAWVTNLAGVYTDNEKSFVEGPCFDFTAMKKPMIKLKTWVNTESTRDGAVIQTSVDDGKTWQVLGSNLDGIYWYNSALLTGNPGGQKLGWTGTTQNNWRESRNVLDAITGGKARIRISFGADAVASNFEGFAFDDIWIGERTRVALLEHFTNSSSSPSVLADADVNEVAATKPGEVVTIQYHTSFPGTDQKNLYYPSGPSSRTLYYGVASVPYSWMDGLLPFTGFTGENGAYSWEDIDLNRRILIDPLCKIDLSNSSLSGTTLNVEADLKLLNASLTTQNLTLQAAVVENATATEKSILRKMIPDAGGTSLVNLWNTSAETTIMLSWDYHPADFADVDSLVLVVFVQNEDTKEVYQTRYVSFKDLIGSAVNPTESGLMQFDVILHPNPAGDWIKITPTMPVNETTWLYIFDQLGKMVKSRMERRFSSAMEWDISDLAPGIYYMKIKTANSAVIQKKFIKIK